MSRRVCREKNDPEWKLRLDGVKDELGRGKTYMIEEPRGAVCLVYEKWGPGLENAKLIVRAVTAYASDQKKIKALVEAGKELIDRFEALEKMYASKTGITYEYENGSVARMDQALQQAGE